MASEETIPLSSALFQASCFLEAAYSVGSVERQICDICAQAAEAIEELEAANERLISQMGSTYDRPMRSAGPDRENLRV
jgi:hypothetical protein